MRVGRHITAISGATVITVGGLFVALSPWLARLAGASGHWTSVTKTDVYTGAGLVVVGLATLLLYRASLNEELIEVGILSRRATLEAASAATDEPPPESIAASISDESLLEWAQSIVAEIPGAVAADASVARRDAPGLSEEDLVRVATSLLTEIQTAQPVEGFDGHKGEQDGQRTTPVELMSEADLTRLATDLLKEMQDAYPRQMAVAEEGSRE